VQFAEDIIDFSTGFFHSHAGFTRHLHYLVLILAFIGLIPAAIIERKRRTRFFHKRMGHFDDTDLMSGGIMLLLAGFAVIYTAIRAGFTSLGLPAVITVFIGTAAYGFAGGVLFFKKRVYPSVGFAFLGLSIYYVLRLVHIFLGNHIILNMTEHLVILILMVVFALFYLSLGRMFIRAESKTTRIKAYVFGTFAALLAASEITAKMIYWFGSPSVTRQNLQRSASEFIMPDMLIAAETIAIISLLLCLTRYKKQ